MFTKQKHYIRYTDDFVFLSHDKEHLLQIQRYIALFLRERLQLDLNPDKLFVKTFAPGVDFLGWVHFADHRVLRASSKRRMLSRLRGVPTEETKQSYLGLLSHGNTVRLRNTIS